MPPLIMRLKEFVSWQLLQLPSVYVCRFRASKWRMTSMSSYICFAGAGDRAGVGLANGSPLLFCALTTLVQAIATATSKRLRFMDFLLCQADRIGPHRDL